jgi:hypothetical protein
VSSVGELRSAVSRIAEDAPIATAAGVADEIEARCQALDARLRTTGSAEVEQAILRLVEAVAKVRELSGALDAVAELCRGYAARI